MIFNTNKYPYTRQKYEITLLTSFCQNQTMSPENKCDTSFVNMFPFKTLLSVSGNMFTVDVAFCIYLRRFYLCKIFKRFSRRSDGRYGFEKYFKLYSVVHSSSNENWFAHSTNTVLATKFPAYFNSTLLFPQQVIQNVFCIDTLFNMCHTLKTRLNT